MFYFNDKEVLVSKNNNFLEVFNENNKYELDISENEDFIKYNDKVYHLIHTTQKYSLNNNEYKFIDCDMYDDYLPIKYAIGKINDKYYLYYLKINPQRTA